MRELFVIALIGVGIWFFTIGVRVGLVGTWPTTILGAKGTNTYTISVLRDGNTVSVRGSCKTWRGKADISILGPQGQTLAAVQCNRGDLPLNLTYRAIKADYRVQVRFDNYFGTLDMLPSAL